MNTISLIALVIYSVFVVTSESKKFCDAFEENGNGIDYTFDFRNLNENKEKSKGVFIIGYHYWLINVNDLDFLRFESNDSDVNDVFGDHYSTVFSVYRSSPPSFENGFLRKNDSKIEWKAMNDFLNFNSTPNEVLKTTTIDLPKEIQSIDNRRLLTFEYFGSKMEFRVFVGQKEIPNSEITRFERTYVSFDFKNGSEETPQQIENQSVVNHSEGDSNVIGVISGIVYNKTSSILVFFQRNQSIEYCFQNTTELLNYSLESPCFTERKVLIDCSTDSTEMPTNSTLISTAIPEKNIEWFYIVLFLIILCIPLLIIICVAFWTNAGGYRERLFGKCCKRRRRGLIVPVYSKTSVHSSQILSEQIPSTSTATSVESTASEKKLEKKVGKTSLLNLIDKTSKQKQNSNKIDTKKTSTKKQSPKK